MKLATYHDGSRDGQLVVVSRDLAQAHYATGICGHLRDALDDWNFHAPQLEDLCAELQTGRTRHAFAFEPKRCMAPLPRAASHVVGNAYRRCPRHAAPGTDTAEMKAVSAPPLCLCAAPSGDFLGARDNVVLSRCDQDVDCEAGIAVITGDIAAGADAAQALDGVRLVMLTHQVVLRPPALAAAASGGCVCAALTDTAAVLCSPVAVTPDELGGGWKNGRLHAVLQTSFGGRKIGRCDAAADMRFSFGDLLAGLASQRRVTAGTVVGTGAVGQLPDMHPSPRDVGKPVRDAAAAGYLPGAHCISERRAIERWQGGAARSRYLKAGDLLMSEMKAADGLSVFGALEHGVTDRV